MRSARIHNVKARWLAVAAGLLLGSLFSAWSPQPAHAGFLDFLSPFTAPGAYPQSSSPQSVARMNAVKVYNSGVHELKNKNLMGAAQCFHQALVFDPSMKEVHGALGQTLFDAGYYEDSFKEMQQATACQPNDASSWCMLALSSCHIQRYDVTLDAFQRYLKLKPKGGYADEARRSVAILQHTVFGNPQGEDRNGNYFADFPAEKLRKWNSNMLPLRVFIADGTGVQGYSPAMQNAVRQSFNDWTVLSDGRLQFALIDDASNAQIICKWTADKRDLGGSDELGICHSVWRGDGNITHADIILLTVYETAPRAQDTERRAKAVYLHEIGHALGLSHSQEPWDIMYPLVAPSGLEFPLTLRDKNTLLALYNNDPTGLIAKRFDAALQPGMNGAPNMVTSSLVPSNGNLGGGFGGANSSGNSPANSSGNGGVTPGAGAGVFNAFSQSPGDNGSPTSFTAPGGMTAPQMPATTAYAPAPPANAFSSAGTSNGRRPTISRSEMLNQRPQLQAPLQSPNSSASTPQQSMPSLPPQQSTLPAQSVPSAPQPQAMSTPVPANNWAAPPAQLPQSTTNNYQQQSFGMSGMPNMQQLSDLNRAAAQATARRDFNEAINKLQDAHRLAPQDQIICRNLGLAFGNAANVAVQAGEFSKALGYYKNALEVLKSSSDRKAYDAILADYQDMVKRQGH